MVDIILEIIRAIIVGVIIYVLVLKKTNRLSSKHAGWSFIIYGFTLVFLGMVFDITDNFPQLNRFIIVGDTPYEAFLEKFVGYLIGFAFVSIGLWKWIPSIEEVEKNKIEIEAAHKKLEAALTQIKKLEGIIPICSYCKKIRDDEGVWNQLEVYIHKHSDAEFSHGVCPKCYNKQMENMD